MNIIDFVANNHDRLKESKFGDVDSLVLCQVYYTRLEVVLDGEDVERESAKWPLKEFNKAEYFKDMFNDAITDKQNFELMQNVFACRRYRDILVKSIVSELDESSTKQFAACCYELDADTDYVCFRGTDGTILGWKEDFEMSFKPEIPSQANAVQYLEKHYGKGSAGENKRIYVGGHSKGGNLAVYAGLMCSQDIQDRIIKIYSHDGPGFRNEIADMLSDIIDRGAPPIVKQVPQASVIGMLLTQPGDTSVIKSSGIGGFMQHSAYSWDVEDGNLVELEQLTKGSKYVDRTVQSWLMSADADSRQRFIEALFSLLLDDEVDTVHDLKKISPTKLVDMKKSFDSFDEQTKELIEGMLRNLAKIAFREIRPDEHKDI